MARATPKLAQVVALGSEPLFLRWARQVCSEHLRVCEELAGTLRVLREEQAALVLVYLPALELQPAELFGLLRGASAEIPLIAVLPAEPEPELRRELAKGGATQVVWLQMAEGEARAAFEQLFEFSDRQQKIDQSVRSLSSMLRSVEQWQAKTEQVIDELLHDLRTPVGVIQGFAANLLDGIHGELGPDQNLGLTRIKAAASYLGELLGASRERLPPRRRAESRRDLSEPRRVCRRQIFLAELCQQVVQMFVPKARAAGIALNFIPGNSPAIWAERARIVQLLVNLVSNALRHTPKGGAVTVELAAEVDHQGRAQGCRIVVRDTGVGIAPEDHQAIFEAGFSTGLRDKHQGMGLAICRQVAAEHQGSLVVESERDQGAAFHLVLPLDPRTREGRIELAWIKDPTLVGQLLLELEQRQGRPPRLDEAQDMEVLARRLLAAGGAVVLTGALDGSLEKLLGR